ncbi:unnamed protein product [Vitrella brassicaformis CCMP3155]|uniref:Uncharacterized protein n=1 Tax=Vitrella brassicaformis (strain CCMP3155) TaxID=1169540 RepID=A0A0G4FJ30_VITBC|nr:unnamed protein product [Vitrella brassicaformis CCMP3155]|eukprot:CEM13729.1 unnamed protein product [Vitrella brassicaformis CCMP3155]
MIDPPHPHRIGASLRYLTEISAIQVSEGIRSIVNELRHKSADGGLAGTCGEFQIAVNNIVLDNTDDETFGAILSDDGKPTIYKYRKQWSQEDRPDPPKNNTSTRHPIHCLTCWLQSSEEGEAVFSDRKEFIMIFACSEAFCFNVEVRSTSGETISVGSTPSMHPRQPRLLGQDQHTLTKTVDLNPRVDVGVRDDAWEQRQRELYEQLDDQTKHTALAMGWLMQSGFSVEYSVPLRHGRFGTVVPMRDSEGRLWAVKLLSHDERDANAQLVDGWDGRMPEALRAAQ